MALPLMVFDGAIMIVLVVFWGLMDGPFNV